MHMVRFVLLIFNTDLIALIFLCYFTGPVEIIHYFLHNARERTLPMWKMNHRNLPRAVNISNANKKETYKDNVRILWEKLIIDLENGILQKT